MHRSIEVWNVHVQVPGTVVGSGTSPPVVAVIALISFIGKLVFARVTCECEVDPAFNIVDTCCLLSSSDLVSFNSPDSLVFIGFLPDEGAWMEEVVIEDCVGRPT